MNHRPQYHFLPPSGWLNDPNGLIYWRGEYHLFYQHNPAEARWGNIAWGHDKSRDLLHWQHLPIAISPTPGGPDEEGCWSGCAVADGDELLLIYTAARDFDPITHLSDASICIARSKDGVAFIKDQEPVLRWPKESDLVGYRDPSVWREGDGWRMIVGAGFKGVGGSAFLYDSADLKTWRYLGPLFTGNEQQQEPIYTGKMWECPQLLRFPQGDALAISVWYNPHGGEHFVAYLSGDYQGNTFVPTGGSRYDWGDSFFAPQAFQDAQGRWISFGWLRERRPQEAQLNAGWSGCMTLPRVLSLSQGRLLQHPAPEVERLRGPGKVWERLEVKGEVDLGEWGQCVELAALLKPLTEPLVFDLRHSTHESTTLILDCPKHQLILDRSNSSLNPEVDHRTLTMPVEPKDLMGLRVFVDASVIEIYLDGQTLTSRIYPTRFEGLRLGLKGEVWVERIEIFPLQTP